MTTTKKKRRGLAPSAAKVKEQLRDGYATPAAAAALYGISNQTIYAWIRDERLEPVGGKPASRKVGANVWVLLASVARHLGVEEKAA